MPDGWTPDEVRWIAAHRDELRPRGVVVIDRIGSALPMVHVPEHEAPHIRADYAASLSAPHGTPTDTIASGSASRRPLKKVMRIAAARRLQKVIDRARDNGQALVHTTVAETFGIPRDRIAQAIELRSSGYDLTESPPEYRAISRSTGFVYWPTIRKPRK